MTERFALRSTALAILLVVAGVGAAGACAIDVAAPCGPSLSSPARGADETRIGDASETGKIGGDREADRCRAGNEVPGPSGFIQLMRDRPLTSAESTLSDNIFVRLSRGLHPIGNPMTKIWLDDAEILWR